ncbi:thiolase family protein [Pseudonocardia pini]|uniref:thiolase family protein n=1 Tax=Pseudonocardia pini TaxID=2758030 RepID=UPI0015EFE89B|nr:thiolase family protein [Pseudonocardia pini]
MTEAMIVAACRTPIGTAHRGTLTETDALALAEIAVGEALRRSGLAASDIDDVHLGENYYGGGDIARHVALTLGMTTVPGLALNRHCASGLSAVATAASGIRAGMERAVIAGGTQSSSTAPVTRRRVLGTADEVEDPWFSPTHVDSPEAPNRDMTITVGWNAAVEAGLTRAQMDEWALRSHRRAVAAIDAGRFEDEIVPVKATQRDGSVVEFSRDEHPRRTTTLEKLASLKPLHPEIEGFSITAGNSSGVNDAASALTLAADDLVAERGLTPLGRVVGWSSVGVDPARTGMASVSAIPLALRRSGLTVDDVALWEINEAFASVPLAACAALGIDPERVNTSGSGCSLGHPVAASGARMLTTMVYELRRSGGGIGVASMCAGGGQGGAVVIEVPGA